MTNKLIKKVDSKDLKTNNVLSRQLLSLFSGFHDTVLLSCLQGHLGTAWVDDIEKPTVAQVIVGDFVFYAGNPNAPAATPLLHNLPNYTLAIVISDEWKQKIEEVHEGHFEKFSRYSFKKDAAGLNVERLMEFKSRISDDFQIKRMDAKLLANPSLHKLSEDFVSQFENHDDFLNRGIGFAITYQNKVVSAASSYTFYDEGIEIEIETHPDYRRRGLGTAVASALILFCLSKGLYPSWDAAHSGSAAMARKLGYQFDSEYDTYYIKTESGNGQPLKIG